MGVIQRRRAAVSVSTLHNDVKRSLWEKQDGVNISRFCHGLFTKCKEAERRMNFKENRKRYGEETEKCNQFPLGNYQRESCSANFIQQQASWNWIQNRRMVVTFNTSTRIFVQNFRVNMVAAIDWCSHTTHDWIWLVSCFGFNGPLRQYFSLYWAVSQRVRKKREKIDERKNVQTTPTRTYCKCNRPLSYYYPN